MENNYTEGKRPRRALGGAILLIVGIFLLLSNIGFGIPHWIFSWHTILLVIGLYIGSKNNFKGNGWFIMTIIGAYFTLNSIPGINFDFSRVGFPIILIAFGAYVLLKPKGTFVKKGWHNISSGNNFSETIGDNFTEEQKAKVNDEDYLVSVNVFGGSNQTVFSKNFKGGDIVAAMGGANINLSQADFEGTVTLDIAAIFGGVKLIIPPNWEVKSEATAIFGGIDDKRGAVNVADPNNRKVLKIQGVALFGGVDIRNF